MASQVKIRRDWRSLWHIGAAGAGVLLLTGWLLFGDTGLFAWSDYSRTLEQQRSELAQVEQEHARLLNHRALLDPNHVDPDFGEELLRDQFDLVHPDDVVVVLPSHQR